MAAGSSDIPAERREREREGNIFAICPMPPKREAASSCGSYGPSSGSKVAIFRDLALFRRSRDERYDGQARDPRCGIAQLSRAGDSSSVSRSKARAKRTNGNCTAEGCNFFPSPRPSTFTKEEISPFFGGKMHLHLYRPLPPPPRTIFAEKPRH